MTETVSTSIQVLHTKYGIDINIRGCALFPHKEDFTCSLLCLVIFGFYINYEKGVSMIFVSSNCDGHYENVYNHINYINRIS